MPYLHEVEVEVEVEVILRCLSVADILVPWVGCLPERRCCVARGCRKGQACRMVKLLPGWR